MTVTVEFCGERHPVTAGVPLTIGRDADLVVDDNPFLHRHFLRVEETGTLWWLANIGAQLSATVSDPDGMVQAWIGPGASLPLVFPLVSVWFTAGPTTYELTVEHDDPPYQVAPSAPAAASDAAATTGPAAFTLEQRLLLVALTEPALRRRVRGAAAVPSSSEAALRLGWSTTKFNRKLDAVCHKLERLGVRGLHGGPDRLAANRKARLVEYALAARLVDERDLELLEGAGLVRA